jgi:hypothetical protein
LYGLERNLEPEIIVAGVTNTTGKRFFLVAWKGTKEGDLVPVEEFTAKYPDMAITFFQQRRSWTNPKSGAGVPTNSALVKNNGNPTANATG